MCAFWANLGDFTTEHSIIQRVFSADEFQEWRETGQALHLFLDSLDECGLYVKHVARILSQELRELPSVENLFFRITCRTADWFPTFESSLQDLWGPANVGVYELAPLQRADVFVAAQANGIDPQQFLDEIKRVEAAPLAIKPVTLNFLLDTFKEGGQLPSRQIDLYERGCRILCTEPNRIRIEEGFTGDFSLDQRLEAASQIAAVMLLTNRPIIWTDYDEIKKPTTDITVGELALSPDQSERNLIRETLNSGLFSSRGLQRMGWTHQTYAEFLAARFVAKKDFKRAQISSLFLNSVDTTGSIIPQLSETLAWLAAMNDDVRRFVMDVDPEVLLQSDVAAIAPDLRAQLVGEILELYDSMQRIDWRRSYTLLRKLSHPDLPTQLLPYMTDSNRNHHVRRLAIAIAEECELPDVHYELGQIALDANEDYLVRIAAAAAIARTGNVEERATLKPLAMGEAGLDPDDRLKGFGLQAVWPDHLTADELFQALTPPKGEAFGQYTYFLRSDTIRHFDIDDIPTALKWVARQAVPRTSIDPFSDVINAIMELGWQHADDPEVCGAFAEAALQRLLNYRDIVNDRDSFEKHLDSGKESTLVSEIRIDHSRRRAILLCALSLIGDPDEELYWLMASQTTPLCTADDFEWSIEQYQLSEDDKFLELANRVFYPWSMSSLDYLYDNQELLPELFAQLGHYYYVEIESPPAEWQRSQFVNQRKREIEQQETERLVAEQVARHMSNLREGNTESWWYLYITMVRDPRNDEAWPGRTTIDITKLAVWKMATEETQQSIVQWAQSYVNDFRPETDEWVEAYYQGTVYFPAYAGVAALWLIVTHVAEWEDSIEQQAWDRWSPFLVLYSFDESVNDLLAWAYRISPEIVIRHVLSEIDAENNRHSNIFVLERLANCWDEQLANSLFGRLTEGDLQPDSIRAILKELLKLEFPEAQYFAQSLISPPYDTNTRDEAVIGASLLLLYAPDDGWEVVWPVLQSDDDLASGVIAAIAGYHRRPGQNLQLREKELADLYLWLNEKYPPEEDPPFKGGLVKEVDEIREFRDSVLTTLQSLGTRQSIIEIERIRETYPDREYLIEVLRSAKNNVARNEWLPPQPSEILELARDPQRRIINNEQQLLSLIIEALAYIEQERLQGKARRARYLWNYVHLNKEEKLWSPKSEADLSDFIRDELNDHLRDSGIIVNREVDIKRRVVDESGERTDILVDAVALTDIPQIAHRTSVIIEVKGNYHSEVTTSMKTQLVDRYLAESDFRFGLYLVGWFECSQWDENDRRKQSAQRIKSIDTARELFQQQAFDLSTTDITVEAVVLNLGIQ